MIQRVALLLVVVVALSVDAKKASDKCKKQDNMAGLIIDEGVNSAASGLAGSCACSAKSGESWNLGFYPSETSTDASLIAEPTINVTCSDMSQVCLYTSARKPIKAYGDLSGVNIYAYCTSSSSCKMYAAPVCVVPGDKKSGLKRGGKKLSCAKAAKKTTIGKKSKYLKVASVSCAGCKGNPLKKAKCVLPYNPLSAASGASGAPGGTTPKVTGVPPSGATAPPPSGATAPPPSGATAPPPTGTGAPPTGTGAPPTGTGAPPTGSVATAGPTATTEAITVSVSV